MNTTHWTLGTLVLLLLATSAAATAPAPKPIMTIPLGPVENMDEYMSDAPCPPLVCSLCVIYIAVTCPGGSGTCRPAEGICVCEVYDCPNGRSVDRVLIAPAQE